MNYGKIFKSLRKERNLSQKQVAAGIVSQSTLSRFEESGNIDFLSLILLLKRLGMTPLEFMQYCIDFEIVASDYQLK
ncbi:helix-turn-helix domain-containing protein [Ligilactobacillus ruminis]|uniref:helix-turn-helix domain-containing protein n=1 Tax=Ligilactobacillus ruminis TaxID=1623 RepID=UPI003F97995D